MRRLAAVGAGAVGATVLVSNDTSSGPSRFIRTMGHAVLAAREYKYGAYMALPAGSEERHAALAGVHQRSAERLLEVCLAHGGMYTKLGQFVASMRHALPPQYPEVLAACQDKAPAVGLDAVRGVVERELGRALGEVFSEFEPEPIGAASLAQVHRAVSAATGERVAVKVQYPALAAQVEADLRTMRVLAWVVGAAFEGHDYEWLLPEFEGSITAELDFRVEAQNAARTAANFADEPKVGLPHPEPQTPGLDGRALDPQVYVPRTHASLSTRRLLTMEFIDGAKLSEPGALAARGLDAAALAPLVSSTFSRMIFEFGFVHCDPHPGNLLARRAPAGGGAGSGAAAGTPQLVGAR